MKIATATLAVREMKEMYRQARERGKVVISSMRLPATAKTPEQRELQAKHGTPRAFADSLVETIGEISLSEATQAIRRYEDEWNASSGTERLNDPFQIGK